MHRLAPLALVLAACAASKPITKPEPTPPPLPSADPLGFEPFPSSLRQPRTAEEARARRHALERLPPDRRALLAIDALHDLLGSPAGLAEARLHAGRWYVIAGGRVVGDLPETPVFSDIYDLLVKEAGLLAGPAPAGAAAAAASDVVLVGDVLSRELEAVNGYWNKHPDPALAARAAHAMVSLAFETEDFTGVADVLQARAWALAAVARALGQASDADEALLAETLEYWSAASEAASRLPAGHPVRAFVKLDDAGLEGASTTGARYLRVRLASLRQDPVVTQRQMQEGPEMQESAFLGAFLRSREFAVWGGLAMPAALVEWAEVAKRARAKDARRVLPQEGELAKSFEEQVAKLLARTGVPFDRDSEAAGARARFFSRLSAAITFSLEWRGIRAEAEEVLKGIGSGAAGPTGDFVRWLELRVSSKNSRDPGPLSAFVDRTPTALGAEAIAQLVAGMPDLGRGNSAEKRFHQLLARRCDGRPGHRAWLAWFAEERDNDPGARERLARPVIRNGGVFTNLTQLRWIGDRDGLQKVAADAEKPADRRISALRELVEGGWLAPAAAWPRMREAVESGGRKRTAVDQAVDFLDDHDLLAEIVEFLGPWVASRPEDRSLEMQNRRATLARALCGTGKAKEAWDAVEPAMASQNNLGLYQGALAQLALGHRKEALLLADRIRDLYDGEPGLTSYAGILWRASAPTEVAEAVAGRIGPRTWRNFMAGIFAHALGARPVNEAEAAIVELVRVERPNDLLEFAEGLAKKQKRPDLAFLVSSRVARKQPAAAFDAYLHLRAAKGGEAALAWWRTQKAPAQPQSLAVWAYAHGAPELLLDPETFSKQDGPIVWRLRAAALVESRARSGPAFEAVVAWFAAERPESADVAIGRFLLGMNDTIDLVKYPAGAYYRGVVAQAHGDVAEAAEWFLDFLETSGLPEREYARERLNAWSEAGKSLSRIAAEGI